MLVVAAVVIAALGLAALSAVAAYRWSGSEAWNRSYNAHGMGLSIELVTLVFMAATAASIMVIMSDAFRTIWLDGAWRTWWVLAAAAATGLGVLVYMLGFAPRILATDQNIPSNDMTRQCRLPYLLYTPYSLVFWLGLIVPLIVVIVLTIRLDASTLSTALASLADTVAGIRGGESADLALIDLEYRESSRTVQHIVDRYLWVVSTFVVFTVLILNTRITTIFPDAAQDSFKWMIWVLLAVGLAVGCLGLARHQHLRSLTVEAHQIEATRAAAADDAATVLAARERLLSLRDEGTIQFLRGVLEGGSLWLLFFSYASQIVLARMTQRSAVDAIFPRPMARFLDQFVLSGEDDET